MDQSAGIQASLSGRYATALFELASSAKTIDAVEASLVKVSQALSESAEFAKLAASPLVGRAAASSAVTAAADVMALDPTTKNFLGVLAQNRRLSSLSAIIRDFRALAARHRGEVTAEVASAHPLTDDQVKELKQALRSRVGRDVTLDLRVDPSFLGGLIVKVGSQMIDSSIKTRINTLAHAMKG